MFSGLTGRVSKAKLACVQRSILSGGDRESIPLFCLSLSEFVVKYMIIQTAVNPDRRVASKVREDQGKSELSMNKCRSLKIEIWTAWKHAWE